MYSNSRALPMTGSAGRDAEMMRSLGDATQKSMTVGSYATGDRTYGAGVVHEQLDDFLLSLQEDQTQLKLMPALYKQPCPGPVFKYDVITAWGTTSPYARAQSEIARPRPDSQVLEQTAAVMKRFGILGQVSFQAMMSDTITDPETLEVRGQTMKLLKDIEELLYTGDSNLNPLVFDGYRSMILKRSPAYNIIDCHGRPLTLDQVDEILAILRDRPNLGQPNVMHLNFKDHARFNREYVPQGRFDITGQGARGFNLEFDRYKNVVGDVEIQGTSFIQPGSRGLISPSQRSELAPVAPTVSAPQVAAAGAGQSSNFLQSDEGSYFYFVQAENQDGVSPLVQVGSAAVNITAGEVVSFTITAGQGPRADLFRVFSTKKNETPVYGTGGVITDANCWEIGAVPNVTTGLGAQPVPYLVTNDKMPGCNEGYVFDTRMETMFWISQMALGKTDLAIFQTAKEFMLNVIGAPALRAPTRVAMFRNIGNA